MQFVSYFQSSTAFASTPKLLADGGANNLGSDGTSSDILLVVICKYSSNLLVCIQCLLAERHLPTGLVPGRHNSVRFTQINENLSRVTEYSFCSQQMPTLTIEAHKQEEVLIQSQQPQQNENINSGHLPPYTKIK
jgi:hypothetical protein